MERKSAVSLSKSTERVQAALQGAGIAAEVRELPESTRTAELAAQAVGCQVGQIAKSLVFETVETHQPVLVITSGANRVDRAKIEPLIGEAIQLAGPDFVRRATGYAIGGVPPVGHVEAIPAYVDRDLMQFDRIWAAAGTPRAVFPVSPDDLLRITSGVLVDVK